MAEISWCDKLASTPGMGITLDWEFLPSVRYQEAMMPVTAKWVDKEKQAFTVDQQDAFSLTFTSFDGFHYAFNSSQIYCEFRHRLKYQAQSAGPPTAELASKPLPYTQMLPQISDRLVQAARLVATGNQRALVRVGVVSATAVKEDEAPPGIRRYIAYMGRPWTAAPHAFTMDVTSILPRTPKAEWEDRCQHVVTKVEHGDELINIRLDFHRRFDSPKALSVGLLDDILKRLRADALKYFEDVGQGERFDESIINDRSK